MTTYNHIKQQLSLRGIRVSGLATPELRHLRRVLQDDEQILGCTTGYYHAGSAVVVSTNKRILIVDKRLFFVNIEELLYHQVKKIEFDSGRITSSMKMYYRHDYVMFRSFRGKDLRRVYETAKRNLGVLSASIFDSHTDGMMNQLGKTDRVWEVASLTQLLPRRRFAKYKT